FDWSRNKMSKRPQPVPPIHTPEVAARAILRAAVETPRELWMGSATFKAIIGTMLMPGLLDHMMARQAWEGQLTETDAPSDQPDNLHPPVASTDRTDGRVVDKAISRALGLASETVAKLIAIGVAVLALVFGLGIAWLAD